VYEYRDWLVQSFTFLAGILTAAFVNIATDMHDNRTTLRIVAMFLFIAASFLSVATALMIQRATREVEALTVKLSRQDRSAEFRVKLRGWRTWAVILTVVFTLAATTALLLD
jgi:hypothetical protein